jgi:hypothetical protein
VIAAVGGSAVPNAYAHEDMLDLLIPRDID